MVYAHRNEGLELSDRNVGRERETGAHLGRGDGGGSGVGGLLKADLDSGLVVGVWRLPVQAMLWTILARLDAPDNGRAAVADDPGASRVLVQEDVVKHVVNSGSLEAVCGDVVHNVVDAVQVLVGGTAGDGLERTGEECGEQVLALCPEEGDDPVYAVAGFGVDAQDMPLEGAVLRNSSCRRVSQLTRDTEIDFAFFGCVFLSFFCGKVISYV